MNAYWVLAVLAAALPAAHGHGLGLDTLEASIDGAGIELSAQLPSTFEDPSKRLAIALTLDGEGVDAVLWLAVEHLGERILQGTFPAPGGLLNLDATTTDGGDLLVEPSPGSVRVSGPAFGSGGLYTVLVRVESLDGQSVPAPRELVLDLLVTDSAVREARDGLGDPVEFTTVSYFDRIGGFEYDAEGGTVEFSMPFDWGADRASHIPVLHQEVRFPKGLEEFMTRGYVGKVNGVNLFRSSVTVDDFSEPDERTVHFVLLQDHINLIRSQLARSGGPLPDGITFTLERTQDVRTQMSAFTGGGDYQVDMTWEPEVILPGQKTKFIFTVRDAYTGETLRHSSYDFVLVQAGRELHRSSGVAAVGGDYREYEFSEEQAGAASVRLENIRGSGQHVEFAFAVAPEFGLALAVLAASAAAGILALRAGPLRTAYG